MMVLEKAEPTGNGAAMRRRFQAGHVYKRGKRVKVWVGCWREWVMHGGHLKRIQRQQVLGKCAELTKSEAERQLQDILRPINGGERMPEQSITFGEFAEKWKAEILTHYRESTQEFYRRTIDRWIIPHFKDWKLSEITTPAVQSFVNAFAGYSKSVIKHVRAAVSVMMSTAVDWQYIARNPAQGIKLPQGKSVTRAPILTPEQIKLLVSKLDEPYRTMVVIAASTGMRESEVLALRWDDVNMLEQTINVRRSLYRGKLGKPKTKESERVIPYGSAAKNALARLRRSRRFSKDFLFVTALGNLFTAEQVTAKVFRPLATTLKLPAFTWRSFRRSAETAMHLGDVPLKVQQQILGHSNPNTTLLYADPSLTAKRTAVSTLEDLLLLNVVTSRSSAGPD